MKTVLCSILLTAVAVSFAACNKPAEKKDEAKKPAAAEQAAKPAADKKP